MKTTNRVLAMIAVVLGVIASQPAFSHNYLQAARDGGVTVIPNIDVSRAAYRELTSASQLDVYEFTATRGQELYIQVTIPLLDREKAFSPGLVLLNASEADAAFDSPNIDNGILVDPPHEIVDRVLPHDGNGTDAEPALLGVTWDAG